MVASEGFVPFRGFRTWFRVAGDLRSGKVPLLLLHGGPGGPSDAFESLEGLAEGGRPVVRYDQLGCGRSDRPRDTSLWKIDTFVDELATVRRELGLDRVHLLGWSWGGMLALEYLFTKPTGVVSLTLASSLANVPLWISEATRLRQDLPQHVQVAMKRFEDNYRHKAPKSSPKLKKRLEPKQIERNARIMRTVFGVIDKPSVQRLAARASAVPFLRRPAYEIVGLSYTKRHVMRIQPFPLSAFQMFAGMNRQVYETMWGPSEFYGVGVLKDWDVTARLGEIDVPTLITSGRYDEATPKQMEVLRDGIPGSEWVVFEESAHSAILEEPERYRDVLEAFLEKTEARA